MQGELPVLQQLLNENVFIEHFRGLETFGAAPFEIAKSAFEIPWGKKVPPVGMVSILVLLSKRTLYCTAVRYVPTEGWRD